MLGFLLHVRLRSLCSGSRVHAGIVRSCKMMCNLGCSEARDGGNLNGPSLGFLLRDRWRGLRSGSSVRAGIIRSCKMVGSLGYPAARDSGSLSGPSLGFLLRVRWRDPCSGSFGRRYNSFVQNRVMFRAPVREARLGSHVHAGNRSCGLPSSGHSGLFRSFGSEDRGRSAIGAARALGFARARRPFDRVPLDGARVRACAGEIVCALHGWLRARVCSASFGHAAGLVWAADSGVAERHRAVPRC